MDVIGQSGLRDTGGGIVLTIKQSIVMEEVRISKKCGWLMVIVGALLLSYGLIGLVINFINLEEERL